MADLRVEDAVIAQALSAFRAASDRVDSLARAIRGFNAEVVGAAPLSEALHTGDTTLAGELEIIGQALAGVAKFAGEAGATFAHVDQGLAQQAGQER